MSSPQTIFKKVDAAGNLIAYLEDQTNSQFLDQNSNSIAVVVGNDTLVNGNNLLAAYNNAKSMRPNLNALSSTNRLVIILPPSIYDLGTQSLTLDTQYIDIFGSTSDRSKHLITSDVGEINRGTVKQTANNVKLHNLTIKNSNTTYSNTSSSIDPAAYFPNSNLNLTYVENVLFTSTYVSSMRILILYSGTFTNCTGGDYSFGGNGGTASGTFTNCTGGGGSFGGATTFPLDENSGIASGTFTNCTGGVGSFGAYGTASGTFKDCTGGLYSFGAYGTTASGTFTNCTGGGGSFGGNGGTASGTFTNCTGGGGSFGAFGTANGTFKDCTGGLYSFGGNGGTANGTFKDCTGGLYSFGAFGTANGTFKDCTGGINSFKL